MPQLQVIDRIQDPSQAALARGAQSVQDTLTQVQDIKLRQRAIKIQAQNAESATEKNRLSRINQSINLILEAKKLGTDPSKIMPLLKEIAGERGAIEALGIVGEAVGESPGTAKEQLQRATAERLSGGGGVGTTGGGDLLMTQIGPSGATFEDPQAAGRVARAETLAREGAKLEAQLKPVRSTIGAFNNQFDSAVKQIGGLPETALGAFAKGTLKSVEAQLGRLPDVQAHLLEIEPTGLAIASFLNRGRPTEPDAVAGRRILKRITYPEATNDALEKFQKAILSAGSEEIGPGNTVVRFGANELVDKAQALVDRLIEADVPPAEINATLQKYYDRVLPRVLNTVGGE